MDTYKANTLNIEGEEVNIELDALADERGKAEEVYSHLERELRLCRSKLPYPDITRYSRGSDYDDIQAIQFQKKQNEQYWKEIDRVYPYYNCGDLYSGHVHYLAGGDRYFIEDPQLPTKEWSEYGHNVMLINVDDRNYKPDIDSWHYPKEHSSVAYSRNVFMKQKDVIRVDVLLDRSDSAYSEITDNYLRNALKRNKSKVGMQSIIQTIQEKQDHIRSLGKDHSFVVQGCAGSGKTMVLLHRLRYLLYNRDIHSEDYVLLVPNPDFKVFIRDISRKFGISDQNIFSYQDYYRSILKKPRSASETIADELVFPADYLQYIYSPDFIRSAYQTVLEELYHQAESFIEFCDDKLNQLLVKEQTSIQNEIIKLKNDGYQDFSRTVDQVAEYIPVPLEDCDSIQPFLSAFHMLIEEQREKIAVQKLAQEKVVIEPTDERVTSDPELVEYDNAILQEEAAVRKASLFTVAAHKKRLKLLQGKRSAYLEELLEKVAREEELIRSKNMEDLRQIFGEVTMEQAEAILEQAQDIQEKLSENVAAAEKALENFEDTIEQKYSQEIILLNRMIENLSDMKEESTDCVKALVPMSGAIQAYIQDGMQLALKIMAHACSPAEAKNCRATYQMLMPKTDRELQGYFYTLFRNSCKKMIREKYKVRICSQYRHYWYLMLYCRYLAYGCAENPAMYLFIDETQDLSPSEIELLYKVNFADQTAPVMNLFGDVNQVISTHGVRNWSEIGFEHEVYTLSENFRNTNQIIEYCNKKIPFRMQSVGVDMDPVQEFPSLRGCLAGIIKHTDPLVFIVKDEKTRMDLQEELKSIWKDPYSVYTVKEAKGLEFRSVVVIDRDMTVNEKYISYTRTLAELRVVHELPVSELSHNPAIVQGED